MTWRPTPQPPCPCANCNQPPPKPVAERNCTEADPCKFCGPVERFWASDPAPVEAPAVPSPSGFTEFGQYTPSPRIGIIDRIRNATNRKA